MYKEILFEEQAREKILKGVELTAKIVSSTLGPRGINVIFEESSFPTITKDGVTVARQIFLEDKFENMGVMMTREAAENTNREGGDGTTSTIVLLESMVKEANKYIITGMNPILIKRGMDFALENILKSLEKQVKKVKTESEKLQIATISANNDEEIGKMILEVVKKVGVDGVVLAKTSNSLKTEVEYVQGTKVDGGYNTIPIFINDRKRLTVNLDNPKIILCTDELYNQNQILPLIEKMVVSGHTKMVLIAKKIETGALAFLAQNHMQGKFTCVPVEMSSFGGYKRDLIYDLAALTNSTVLGLEDAFKIEEGDPKHAGTCENIVIGRDSTIVSGGKGKISERIKEIKTLLKGEKEIFGKKKLNERLGKLTGAIANINVGGSSETEQTEVKYRIEDALNATRYAIKEGIVEGGGVALLKCIEDMPKLNNHKEFNAGIEIVYNSLKKPLEKIVSNSGKSGEATVEKVLESGLGYNALTEKYGNLFKMGIIDPYRVVQKEITNAVATAGILLTSSCAIVNKVIKENNQ